MKVFEGETYPDLLKETARRFANCKGFKPKSTRDISKEMFIVAMGFRDAAPDTKPQG
jgi:23S rRNA U2552 (ribose-2'-O)-methylase RlmE/FtsJ